MKARASSYQGEVLAIFIAKVARTLREWTNNATPWVLKRVKVGLPDTVNEPHAVNSRGCAGLRLGQCWHAQRIAQYNAREYGLWGALTEALRSGKPRTELQDHDHFGSIYDDPMRFKLFVDAMTAGSFLSARRIAESFPRERYQSLCNIGTAQGCLPVEVAQSYQHIGGIGFDLPSLKTAFESYVRDHGLSQRLHFRGGEVFREPFPNADVIVLGRVLHNWELPTKKMLLAKAYQAVLPGGDVIVYDMLIDDDRTSSTCALLSSLNMLLWTSGGFGYTGTDCIGWMREVGFRDVRIEQLLGGNSMVVGSK